MLDQLQADNEDALWGENGEANATTTTRGSVVACDFYNAGSLISLSDEKIIDILMKELEIEAAQREALKDVQIVIYNDPDIDGLQGVLERARSLDCEGVRESAFCCGGHRPLRSPSGNFVIEALESPSQGFDVAMSSQGRMFLQKK